MPETLETVSATSALRPLFIGVDVGGTNIKIGLIDDAGRTIARSSIATLEERGLEDAIQRMQHAIADLIRSANVAEEDVAAIGLATPGSMDIHRGYILEPPNMPHWRNFPIRDRLSEVCGKPVSFANDANAAAFGEFWKGSAQGFDSVVMFTLGTGVGGGIILNGVSIDGKNSFGSELGHIVIDHRDDARTCVWGGGRGELEAYASASGVVARARDALAAGQPSSIRERLENGETLTTLMLHEEAEKGDEFSRGIILETAKYLGVGVVTTVHAVDPGAVVLGGAMNFGGPDSPIGRMFLERVREEFRRRCYGVVRETLIDFAKLGGNAGYIGAAGIARAAYKRRSGTHAA
jgi:glucokinase